MRCTKLTKLTTQAHAACSSAGLDPIPIIVLSASAGTLSHQDVLYEIQRFQSSDDVFSLDFLCSYVVIQVLEGLFPNEAKLKILFAAIGWELQRNWKVEVICILSKTTEDAFLPAGPYFLHSNQVHQAWKLYPDPLDSFQTSVIPKASPHRSYEYVLHTRFYQSS